MADQMTNEVIDQETAEAQMVEVVQPAIEKLIYVIRDKQVMIDSDLAMLYHVETKRLNEAVKRNIARFPEEFRFQLTEKETESLRSQIATMRKKAEEDICHMLLQSRELLCFRQYSEVT